MHFDCNEIQHGMDVRVSNVGEYTYLKKLSKCLILQNASKFNIQINKCTPILMDILAFLSSTFASYWCFEKVYRMPQNTQVIHKFAESGGENTVYK